MMNKKTAKTILEMSDEKLICLWDNLGFEEYRLLLKKRSKEEIVALVKEVAKDVLNERPTTFQMKDEKGNRYAVVEYLGDE
jgi:hypothetical protein